MLSKSQTNVTGSRDEGKKTGPKHPNWVIINGVASTSLHLCLATCSIPKILFGSHDLLIWLVYLFNHSHIQQMCVKYLPNANRSWEKTDMEKNTTKGLTAGQGVGSTQKVKQYLWVMMVENERCCTNHKRAWELRRNTQPRDSIPTTTTLVDLSWR